MKTDSAALLGSIKANRERLKGCVQHRFDPGFWEAGRFGQKMTCLNCGGVMSVVPDIGRYIEGFKAAGGDVNDVWPGYENPIPN